MKSILAGVLLMASAHLFGCDICGIYLGIQPHDRTTSFGLFYRYRLLAGQLQPQGGFTVLKHGDAAATVPVTYRELYQVAELRGDIWFHPRWSALVSVPYVNNFQSIAGDPTADLYGLGDPLVLMRYVVANTRCLTEEERTVHRFVLGGGVKFPMGRTDMAYHGEPVDHDLQPGTGTWDALVSIEYMVRRHELGAVLSLIGRRNGTSASAYQFGHSLSTAAEVFRTIQVGSVTMAPSLGAYWELAGEDRAEGSSVAGTEQNTLFASIGARAWWHSLMFTATFQPAVVHASGALMVPNRERLILGLIYNFNNN